MRSSAFLRSARVAGRVVVQIAAVATMLGLATACGTTTTKVTSAKPAVAKADGKIVSVATLKPGQPVPLPTDKPVLTVTGKISTTNQGNSLVFDQPTLAKLGVQQVELYEPWAKQNLAFRGVWLQNLLAVAGVGADAVRLHFVALDDYQVDLTVADIRGGGIMLATSAGDGSPIPIDKGGPTRIVFMDGVKAGANADQWIWSLKTVDVQ
jgi:hypothetical protein